MKPPMDFSTERTYVELCQQYRFKYGTKECDKMCRCYYDGRQKQKEYQFIPEEILSKLIELLPPLLSTKQRAFLLEKILGLQYKIARGSVRKDMEVYFYWDEYEKYLNAIITILQDKAINQEIVIPPLSKDIIAFAPWILDNDMILTQNVFLKTLINTEHQKYMAAANEVKLFLEKCNCFKNIDSTHVELTLIVDTFDTCYNLRVVPPKTNIQKLRNLF